MKKDFYNKAINLINEIRFVKETQLQKFLKIDENTTDNLINSLIRRGYAKKIIEKKIIIDKTNHIKFVGVLDKISVLNDTYIVPYNYLYNEKEFEKTKNEVIENGKALDLLIHISKRNVVTEYYLCSKKPVNLVFICEFTNRDTKEREYKLFEIMYVKKGNETISNILADRLLYATNSSLTPINFVIVDDEQQIDKLRLDNVGGYFTINDDGSINKLN